MNGIGPATVEPIPNSSTDLRWVRIGNVVSIYLPQILMTEIINSVPPFVYPISRTIGSTTQFPTEIISNKLHLYHITYQNTDHVSTPMGMPQDNGQYINTMVRLTNGFFEIQGTRGFNNTDLSGGNNFRGSPGERFGPNLPRVYTYTI
jgi:hypothetical protein